MYSPIKAFVATRSSCAEQSQVLFLLVSTSWDPNRGGVGQLTPIKAVVVTISSWVEQSRVVVSPSKYFLRPQTVWGWAAIPCKSCCCHKKLLRGAVAGFVSPCQYFLRLPTGVELGSYHLIKLFLSQKGPARSCRRFCFSSSMLFETPTGGGVGQLSPLLKLLLSQEAPARSNRKFCFSSSILLETPTGLSWAASSFLAFIRQAMVLFRRLFLSFEIDIGTSWERFFLRSYIKIKYFLVIGHKLRVLPEPRISWRIRLFNLTIGLFI